MIIHGTVDGVLDGKAFVMVELTPELNVLTSVPVGGWFAHPGDGIAFEGDKIIEVNPSQRWGHEIERERIAADIEMWERRIRELGGDE